MSTCIACCLRLFCLIPAFLLFAGDSGKKPVTVQDLVSYPRPEPLVPIWAPDGRSFLYEQQTAVYLYSVRERKSKEWFQPASLDRVAVPPSHPSEFGWKNRRVAAHVFQWFPNGRDLLVSAGGDLFVVHANGKFDQLTRTAIDEEDPKLSPDGKRILYRSNANLYVIDCETKHVRQLTFNGTTTLLNGQLDWVYPEELDLGTATWWSPDSTRIAYLQFDVSREFVYPQTDLLGKRAASEPERYPQAGTPNAQVRLGEVSAEGGETKWIQLGETSDALLARVAWLPDSSRIAVERLNRVQNKLDLLFCDPGSGAVNIVLQEHSRFWINMADNLFFLRSRPEFIWTSERSGFRHVYRYSDAGKLLGQLTTGDWEVTTIAAIDEAHGRLYYTSSELSPLQTQLYSISLDGGARTRLTRQEGTHEIHANSDASYFIDAYSNLKQPNQTILADGSGEQLAVVDPMDKAISDEYDIRPSEIVQLKTSDGTELYARLIRPSGYQEGVKYPVIVYVYGGPGVQSVRDRWYGMGLEQVLAHRGYVVWQLDNRGSKGRGTAFEAPIYRRLGRQEIADQRLGVEYLIQNGLATPDQIGIFGWSYGGYMTIRSLLFAPDLFKVGVAGAPVTDWRNYDTIYTERYMGLPDQNTDAYDASSNVKQADKLQGRLLILHNFEDDNVLFQNTMQMANALEHANKQFFMQIYPQKTHGVSGPLQQTLDDAVIDFFDTNLKTRSVN